MLGFRFWFSTAESLVTFALTLRTALMPLPGCASMRIMPSTFGNPASELLHLMSLPACWQKATPCSATAS